MKMNSPITYMLLGALGVITYQQIKNGNMQKFVKNVKNKELKMLDEMEDMM